MTLSHVESIPALGRAIRGFAEAARSPFSRHAIAGKSRKSSPVISETPSAIPSTMASWNHLPNPRNRPPPPGSKARSTAPSVAGASSIADTTLVRESAILKTNRRNIVSCHRTSCRTALVARHRSEISLSDPGSHVRILYRTVTRPAVSHLAVATSAPTSAIRARAGHASRLSTYPAGVAGPRQSPFAIKATYSLHNASAFAAPSSTVGDTNVGTIAARGRRRPRSAGGRSATPMGISRLSTYACRLVAAL